MPNAKDITVENLRLNVLAYSASGGGKTTFACSFREAGPVFVADFDGGMLGQRGKDIEYETFDNYADFDVKMQEWGVECPFETIVIDSITTLQEYKMDDLLLLNSRKMPTVHEYNVMISDLKDLFMRLTKMTKHVVVIAHEQLKQDEITGEIFVVPVIVGKKMPALLPLWFDEVYHFGVTKDAHGTPVYYFDTVAQDKYMGKSRLNVLPARVEWSEAHPSDIGKAVPLSAYNIIMGKVKGEV